MLRKTMLASAALALAMSPIAAQAAPQDISRAPAAVDENEQLRGTGLYIVGAIVLGLIIWGIIELSDDNDSPHSP